MKLSLRMVSLMAAGALAAAACGGGTTPTATRAPANTEAAVEATPEQAEPTTTAGLAPTEAATVAAASETPVPTEAPAASPTAGQPGEFDPANYHFEQVAEGYTRPLLLTHAGDGSGRMFVVEQRGVITLIQDGQRVETPFLDVQAPVGDESNEQGLLGLAFAPDYAQSGTFYIDYTDNNGDTHVDECQVSQGDPNAADPESCTTILFVEQPYPNHNGGHLAFGPDGYLYIGLGDGGSGGDPQGHAQNPRSLLGKLLRIDPSGDEAPYSVPADNPFAGGTQGRAEIWVLGLRNPWRYSFDRGTGDLFIGDVGQNAYEEISYLAAGSPGGANFGWNLMEGTHPFPPGSSPPNNASLVPPIVDYAQSVGGCSVTGGYVYRGPSLPELNGVYFYGDYCTGLVWTLVRSADAWTNAPFAQSGFTLSSFGEDEAGELYLVDHGGAVYRLAGN
jgi:glucose/arabinose dehydrogenase